MGTRAIGSLRVSVVGLGCNNFGKRLDYAQTDAVIQAALQAGITFFDTADIYGSTRSEEYLGRALGARRREVIVATKFGMAIDDQRKGAKPDYIRRAVDDSLRRLGTDYIDLYQLHQPDPSTPIGETLAALDALVRAGKVREIGCSNFSVEQLREAEQAVTGEAARFVSVQNEYSLLCRDPENGVLQECQREGLALIPYFPLASGLLTGKYRLGQIPPSGTRLATQLGKEPFTESNLRVVESLLGFAIKRGHSLTELAIAWLASRPRVASVIAGATSPEQVQINAQAVNWQISPHDLAELDELLRHPASVPA